MYKFLKRIAEKNILLDVVEGKLKLYSESDTVESDLLAEIKSRKEELIQFLTDRRGSDFIKATNFKKQSIRKIEGGYTCFTEQETELLEIFTSQKVDYPKNQTLTGLFEEQVKKTPNNIALVVGDKEFTYCDLDGLSNQLARCLSNKFYLKPGDLVAIQLDRSHNFVISILAILKLGCAYIPIDPNYPNERKKYILEDTKVNLLITTTNYLFDINYYEGVVFAIDVEFELTTYSSYSLGLSIDSTSIAYIIYTSGSTGFPKGVIIEHISIVNTILSQVDMFGLSSLNKGLQFASFSFDASIWEIFIVLLSGAQLYIASEEDRKDPKLLEFFIYKNEIDFATLPPYYFNLMNIENLKGLKILITAGESPDYKKVKEFSKLGTYYNAYGPTETSICASIFKMNRDYFSSFERVPIGKAISNTSIYVLGSSKEILTYGVKGEIFIGGAGLARGYLNQNKLTDQKFIKHPFIKGERIYKTGDMGMYLPDGNIEFLGRKDSQIKIRGFRVELGEIEFYLKKITPIKEAVVLASKDLSGEKQLFAYYTSNDENNQHDISAGLAKLLPEYMIPKHFIKLDQFFLTLSGKIDRENLPTVSENKINKPMDIKEYPNEVEGKLLICCKEVLERDKVGIEDDFFKLGGHSLDVIKVINKLEVEFHLKLEVQVFFEERILRKISKFARKIEKGYNDGFNIIDDEIEGKATKNQEKFWFIQEVNNNYCYNIPLLLEWEGEMDFPVFTSAVNETIRNNKILRTRFVKKNNKILKLVEAETNLNIEFLDWSKKIENWKVIEDHFFSIVKERFDLERSQLFKFRIYKLSKEKYALALVVHHIIMDDWSIRLWFKEIFKNYNALKNIYPILCKLDSEQFSSISYVAHKDNSNDKINLEKAKNYWINHLNGVEKNELPWFNNVANIGKSESRIIIWSINKLRTNKLHLLAEQNKTSVFAVVLSSYIILLRRLIDIEEITIGVPFSGRDTSNVMNEIGNFVNLLPFRTRINDSNNFIQIIKETRDFLAKAQKYQNHPIEEILEELSLPNDLFDSGFTWHGDIDLEADTTSLLPRINVRSFTKGIGKFPLWVYGTQTNEEIKISVEYITDHFNKNCIQDFITCWDILLDELIDRSKDKVVNLKVLSERQLKEIDGFSEGPEFNQEEDIITVFEETVHNFSERTALNFIGEKFTYKQLNQYSNELSNCLIINYDIRKGDHVLLLFNKSPYVYISILAILKLGAVYVPIHSEAPLAHLESIKKDINPKLIITTSEYINISTRINLPTIFCDLELTSSEIFENPIVDRSPLDIAYIMYTSGSTGKPKGVEIMHKSVVRLAKGSNFQVTDKSDINLGLADYSFDGSVQEIFTTLLNGAQLVCASKEKMMGLKELTIAIKTYKINNLPFITTQLFNQIVDYVPDLISDFKMVYFGGEDASVKHVKKSLKYRKNSNSIVHVYGPTEGAVFTSFYTVENVFDSKDIPIGKPVTGTSIYVLNSQMKKVPKGIIGEIYIGGAGLAKGYINNPEETDRKFIKNPFTKKSRIYATGDYGKWDISGNLIFKGRKDNQLKIRGYRVEIGEVINALNKCSDISRAFVIPYENKGTKELVAYVAGAGANNISKLRQELKDRINIFSIPTYFVVMEKFPLNKNGKIDITALPIPNYNVDFVEIPTSKLEHSILEIWKNVLGKDLIGISCDFFELGGQSIKLIAILAAIEENLNLSLSIGEFFSSPTVKGIAKLLRNRSNVMQVEPVVENDYHPLSHSQRRLWVYQELNPQSIKYNIVGLYEVEGNVSSEIIRNALEKLILRHESLRTTFHVRNGVPCQKTHSKAPVFFEYIKCPDKTLREVLNKTDYNKEFQLDQSPLLRVRIFETKDKNQVLYFSIHHIVCDEWSFNIIFKDFFRFLSKNNNQAFNDLRVQYKDFSYWHNSFVQSEEGVKQKLFWKSYLDGLAEPVHLKFDKKSEEPEKINRNIFFIDQKQTDAFKKLCIKYEGTLFMGVIALLNTILYKYTNIKDIVIGSPVAGRQQVELNDIVGIFVNILPIRSKILKDDTFLEIFKKTRKSTILALENQQYPYDLMVDQISNRNYDLFKIGLTWQNVLDDENNNSIKVDGLTFNKLDYGFDQVFQDLWIFGREVEKGMSFSVRYNSNNYSDRKMDEFVSNIKMTMDFILKNSNLSIEYLNLSSVEYGFKKHEISDIKFKF